MADLRTIIAIDQGTTSSRAILFDETGTILAQQSAEFPRSSRMMDGLNMIPKPSGRPPSTSPAPWSKKHGPAAAFPSP